MKITVFALAAVLGTVLLAPTASFAKSHQVPCSQIQKALKDGKSEDQVAKDMKVSLSRVKSCSHAHEKK